MAPVTADLRPLSLADLPQVGEVHMRAFPDSALSRLGLEAVKRYYEWQLIGPHDSVALGCFHRTTLMAFCVGGVFEGSMAGFLARNRGFLVRRLLTRPWLVLNPLIRQRITSATRSLRARPPTRPVVDRPKSFGILSIATDPSFERQGWGALMMQEMEERARGKGFVRMHLSVEPDNVKAVNFYSGQGWKEISAGRMTKAI